VEVRELGLLRVLGKQDPIMAFDVLRWHAA
jgi:hypothetical protein